MPLRRWMSEHGYPAWYSWVVVLALPLATSAGMLMVTLNVLERTIDAERTARGDSERALCQVIVIQDEALRREAPETDAGSNLSEALGDLRRQYRCDER